MVKRRSSQDKKRVDREVADHTITREGVYNTWGVKS
jgi:hypothetical protein